MRSRIETGRALGAALIAGVLCTGAFVGCGSDGDSATASGGKGGFGATGATGAVGAFGGNGATDGGGGFGAFGATGGTGNTGGGDPCPGATLCGASCTNTNFDPANCGSCNNACPAGQLCSAGQCGLTCAGGSTLCTDKCVDTQNDPTNCGTCGKACAAGEVCSAGQCGVNCAGGTTLCTDKCVDVQNDPANCGSCGNPCPSGQVCSAGTCNLSCVGGTTLCGNTCTNTDTDPANCGTCGNPCQGGQVCDKGACALQCSGGTTKCGSACVDTNTDSANCGSCGNPCASGQVCSGGACASVCGGNLTKCGNSCVDTQTSEAHCGSCGKACGPGEFCTSGACTPCNSATTDCDGDGWLVSEGDCCDKPGVCGNEPKLVNPGALEVVGNSIDDNCNGLIDLFDQADTIPCDSGLTSNSSAAGDYAKAMGLCRTTTETPAQKKDKTWGLISAEIQRADGSALGDARARSIRTKFGTNNNPVEGSAFVVLSSGIAADATQTNPGPNGGPGGGNVDTTHSPSSSVNISTCTDPDCIKDWFATANAPLKAANALPTAPNCGSGTAGSPTLARDSVMLKFRLRAPTNARAFSFNSYFISAEYPEFVCTNFNDQLVALVKTPSGTPSPIANPVDLNLMTFLDSGGKKWPIGINVAAGTNLFSVCESQAANPGCWDTSVAATSCALGMNGLLGTGFEKSGSCLIGGGTYWLTTAGNVIPGEIVELRIVIWDVGDTAYDSMALLDGFKWLANATLPGTG
ncbi:MAG: MXAN_6577-like cysteine-rich protein [Polyangiaceae bacterium]